jgi:hypothetical protein
MHSTLHAMKHAKDTHTSISSSALLLHCISLSFPIVFFILVLLYNIIDLLLCVLLHKSGRILLFFRRCIKGHRLQKLTL